MPHWNPIGKQELFIPLLPMFTADGVFVWFKPCYRQKLENWTNTKTVWHYLSKEFVEKEAC